MRLRRTRNRAHSSWRRRPLKRPLALGLLLLAGAAQAPQRRPGAADRLRAELSRLLEGGQTAQAIRRAQQALQAQPGDPAVRHEYAALHLALARRWLAQRRFVDCLTALDAVLAAEPGHSAALGLRRQIVAARARAGARVGQVQRLLRLELFDAALARIREIGALRPDLADSLRTSERAAWLGAADDHYLAGNFPEALALYERALSAGQQPGAKLARRWGLALALALFESAPGRPIDADTAARIMRRAREVLAPGTAPLLLQAIAGALAERAGNNLEAGRTYAAALGQPWELPPSDQRRRSVQRLAGQVAQRLRELYRQSPTGRRRGAWLVVLADSWKQRRTAHLAIYARNDLVAERVADAAEFHLAGIAQWLGLALAERWEPRCELRVHPGAAELRQATGAEPGVRAVSRVRRQGERLLSCRLDLLQSDPLLLNTTLPNELAHLLIADRGPAAKLPLAIVEGLALRAEPPARRLLMRRMLGVEPPAAGELLAARELPGERTRFQADCSALVGLLLHRLSAPGPAAVRELLAAFGGGRGAQWWRRFGWSDEAEMGATWRAWYAARRNPPRMPLMTVSQAPEEPGR